MKKCTGVLISVVVLVLISYFFFGLILQSTFNKNINGLNKKPFFNLQVKDYQRGWFSSSALLRLNVEVPEQNSTANHSGNPPLSFDLDYPLTLLHGPFIFSDFGIRFGIGQITTTPQTHYNAMVNYLNKTVIRYAFPSLALKMTVQNQLVQFALSGIQAVFKFSPDIDSAKGYLKFLGMNGSAGLANFKVGEVLVTFDITRYLEGLWVGNSLIASANIEATDGTKRFALEDFKLGMTSGITNQLLNIAYDLSIKKLSVEHQDYGPETFKISIRNLNPEALGRINKMISSMAQQKQQDWPFISLSIMSEVPKLLSQGSELELEQMIVNLPDGQIEGHFKVALPNENNSDVAKMLRKAHGEGQFKAPMVLVKKLIEAATERNLKQQALQTTTATTTLPTNGAIPTTPVVTDIHAEAQQKAQKTLDDYVAKGLLKVEGSDYVVRIKIENETFFVNDKPFNPSMM